MGQHYIDEIDGVFFTDRTAATDAEFRSRMAPFESAPTPPEVVEARVVEEVARAIAAASDDNAFSDGDDGGREDRSEDQDYYRTLAAAAVAVCRAAQDGGAEEAVRDDREPKVCPRCGQTCTYDGWDHVHASGIGIGSCAALAPQAGEQR